MNENVSSMNMKKGKQAHQIYIRNAFVQDVCFYYVCLIFVFETFICITWNFFKLEYKVCHE